MQVLQALFRNFAVYQLLQDNSAESAQAGLLDIRVDHNYNRVRSRFVQGDLNKDPLRPILYITPPKRGNRNSYVALLQTAEGKRPVCLKFAIAPDSTPTSPMRILQPAQTLDETVERLLGASRQDGTLAFGVPLSPGKHAFLGIQLLIGDSWTKLLVAVASKGGTIDPVPIWKQLQIDEHVGVPSKETREGDEPVVQLLFESSAEFETAFTAT